MDSIKLRQKCAEVEADLISAAAHGENHLFAMVAEKFAELDFDDGDIEAVLDMFMESKTADMFEEGGTGWGDKTMKGLGLAALAAPPIAMGAKFLKDKWQHGQALSGVQEQVPDLFEQDPERAKAMFQLIHSTSPNLASNSVVAGDLMKQMMAAPMVDLGTVGNLSSTHRNLSSPGKGPGGISGLVQEMGDNARAMKGLHETFGVPTDAMTKARQQEMDYQHGLTGERDDTKWTRDNEMEGRREGFRTTERQNQQAFTRGQNKAQRTFQEQQQDRQFGHDIGKMEHGRWMDQEYGLQTDEDGNVTGTPFPSDARSPYSKLSSLHAGGLSVKVNHIAEDGTPCFFDWSTPAMKMAGITDAFSGNGTVTDQANNYSNMQMEALGSDLLPLDSIVRELLSKEQELAQREDIIAQQEMQMQQAMQQVQQMQGMYQDQYGADPMSGQPMDPSMGMMDDGPQEQGAEPGAELGAPGGEENEIGAPGAEEDPAAPPPGAEDEAAIPPGAGDDLPPGGEQPPADPSGAMSLGGDMPPGSEDMPPADGDVPPEEAGMPPVDGGMPPGAGDDAAGPDADGDDPAAPADGDDPELAPEGAPEAMVDPAQMAAPADGDTVPAGDPAAAADPAAAGAPPAAAGMGGGANVTVPLPPLQISVKFAEAVHEDRRAAARQEFETTLGDLFRP
jgi:type II secretory pathway pseudopilin PulG